ncbi:MAG TPA: ACT domain-containing protein [Caldithrix abyssi]|uniref:aspartate kinase n=1 Tax=Caldithrix abyssi TaxID=187145 RepID=A0A7V4TXD4_CALAY|nr:ACT domain-containing protein [Caldithrix abyssi]
MKIGGLVEQKNLTLYSITSLKDQPGAAASVLRLFAKAKINLEYITEAMAQDGTAVLAFCINAEDMKQADEIIKNEIEDQSHSIKKQEYVGIIGIYGPHFREKPAIAATFCNILGDNGINILGISSSISTISCVIDVRDFDRAKDAVLEIFELP